MHIRPLLAALAAAATLAAAPAFAENEADMSFSGMVRMSRMDTDKDGMVSKQEFLATMAKVYDMKAKEMKVRGDKVTEAQMRELLMYLRAGG